MNVYLIKDCRDMDLYEWYDSYDSFCIIANNEKEVRKMASENAGDEGIDTWLNDETSAVELVSSYTGKEIEPFILISSFNAA